MTPYSSEAADISQKLAILPRSLERINIFAPLLFVVFFFIEWAFLASSWTSQGKLLVRLFTEILLLNGIHAAITFFLLAGLPEARAWAAEKRFLGANMFGVAGILFAAFFVFFFLCSGAFLGMDPDGAVTIRLLVFTLLIRLLPQFHGIRQIMGISALYTQRIRLAVGADPSVAAKVEKSHRLERIGFNLMSVSMLGLGGAAVLLNGEKFETWTTLGVLWILLIGLACAIILIAAWEMPLAKHSNKFLYLSRVLIFVFAPVSWIGLTAMNFFHGVEYFCITREMAANSKADARRLFARLAPLLILAGIILVLRPWYFGYEVARSGESYLLAARILGSLSLALSFAHYLLDGFLFRFSDPVTRRHIGPLLAANA